jgi:hypothetical protein
MRKITIDELKEILHKHLLWRRGEPGGGRADLRGADLSGAYLSGAYLSGAYLRDAYLRDADLSGAYLSGADLSGAYLSGADLRGAYLRDADLRDADLRGADLSGAYLSGADLRDAYLRDAYLRDAYLRDAYLRDARNIPEGITAEPPGPPTPELLARRAARAQRYRQRYPEVPIVENLDAKILEAIEDGGTLDMSDWHRCKTTHCRAGWAITLAGKAGQTLETDFGSELAGAMIYRASTGHVPDFFATTEVALEDIEACAKAAEATR